MDRTEKIAKLNEITCITTNLVITYDMGIQFDVMTSNGTCTNIGNIGNWPCFKCPVSPEIVKLKDRIENEESITIHDILDVKICSELLTYTDMYQNGSWIVEGKVLENLISNMKEAIKQMDTTIPVFYAYVNAEDWGDNEVRFFRDYSGLCEFFAESFGDDDELYEDMDDEQLDAWLEVLKEDGKESVVMKDLTKLQHE